jgi:hypothetical protein
LAAFAAYALYAPVASYLNEADRLGNGAARFLLVIIALISGIAFGAGYAVSVLRLRKSLKGSQAGFE